MPAKTEREDIQSSPFASIVLKEKKEKPAEKTVLKPRKSSEIIQGYNPSADFADILYNWEHTGNPYALPEKKRIKDIEEKKTSFADILAQWEGQDRKKSEKEGYRRASAPYKPSHSFADILSAFEGGDEKTEERKVKTSSVSQKKGGQPATQTTFFKEMEEDDEIPDNVSWSVFTGSCDVKRPEEPATEAQNEVSAPMPEKRKTPSYKASRDFASILDEYETRMEKKPVLTKPVSKKEVTSSEEDMTSSLFRQREEDDEIPDNVSWSVFTGARDIVREEHADLKTSKMEQPSQSAAPHRKHCKPVRSQIFIREVEKAGSEESFEELLKQKGDTVTPHKEKTINELRMMLPQATLDLHGMTQEEAEGALSGFIRDAVESKLEKIAVIHGKGLHSEDGVGILKDVTMQVLEKSGCCREAGFAKPGFGGSGVTWVILKKEK